MAEENTVFNKAIHATKWVTAGVVVARLINIVTLVTLARMLTPEIYGIMIASSIVIDGISIISNTGYGTLAVQSNENIEKFLDQAWTIEILKGILWLILIVISSTFITKLFNIEGNEAVIIFGGFSLLIMSLKNIGSVLLVREMKFNKIFIQQVSQQLAYLIVALTWAFVNPSVWALVAGTLASSITMTVSTYFLHQYRPKLNFHLTEFLLLIKKTKWIMGTNILDYFMSIVDTGFIGHLLGPISMGIYSKARDISILPSSYISQLTNNVGFAGIARVQGSPDKVRDGFMKMFDVSLMISTPFLLVFLSEADRIVPLLLGNQWLGMVAPLKLLTIAMTIRSFVNITIPVFNGIGHFNSRFYSVLIQFFSTIFLLYYLVPHFQINGAAYSVIISFSIVLIFSYMKLIKLIDLNIFKIFPSIVIVLLSSVITTSLAFPFHEELRSMNGTLYLLTLTALGLVYCILVLLIGYFTNRGPYLTIVRTLLVFRKNSIK